MSKYIFIEVKTPCWLTSFYSCEVLLLPNTLVTVITVCLSVSPSVHASVRQIK